jgi:hypothetical protein
MFRPLLRNGQKTVVYFPAVTKTRDSDVGPLTFFSSSGQTIIERHPYVLFSAGTYYKKRCFRKEDAHIPDDVTVFGDSGGYQLLTRPDKVPDLNNEVSLRWCQENADIFPILDRPLQYYSKMDDCLNKTREAAVYYAKNKPDDKLVLNVASGNRASLFPEWCRKVIEPHIGIFDGVCHGRSNASKNIHNLEVVFKFFFHMLNKGVFDTGRTNYYHLFGVGSNTVALYLMLFQKLLNSRGYDIQVSYDTSTTSFITNSKGSMLIKDAIRGFKQYQVIKHLNEKTNTFDDFPDADVFKDIKKYQDEDWRFVVSQHNLKKLLDWKREYEFYINNPLDIAKERLDEVDKVCLGNLRVLENCFVNPSRADKILSDTFRTPQAFDYTYNDIAAVAINEKEDADVATFNWTKKSVATRLQPKLMEQHDIKVFNWQTALIPGEMFV